MNSLETNPEILEARKKLAEKFVNTKIGGKGNHKSNSQVHKEERKCLNINPQESKIRKFNQ